jgi:hypothetical protein
MYWNYPYGSKSKKKIRVGAENKPIKWPIFQVVNFTFFIFESWISLNKTLTNNLKIERQIKKKNKCISFKRSSWRLNIYVQCNAIKRINNWSARIWDCSHVMSTKQTTQKEVFHWQGSSADSQNRSRESVDRLSSSFIRDGNGEGNKFTFEIALDVHSMYGMYVPLAPPDVVCTHWSVLNPIRHRLTLSTPWPIVPEIL